MNTDLNKFIEISNIISLESDLLVKKTYEWIDFIKPKFELKFPSWEYRLEYEKHYNSDVKTFLKKQKRIFDKKFNYLFFLINKEDEILDKNLNWNDCIVDLQDEYALFSNIEQCEGFKYSSIGIITFLN